jgi:hypothetical protein
MDQSQIETIILERIEELQRHEIGARLRCMKVSYQDKRDELEALLLRIHGLAMVEGNRDSLPVFP